VGVGVKTLIDILSPALKRKWKMKELLFAPFIWWAFCYLCWKSNEKRIENDDVNAYIFISTIFTMASYGVYYFIR